MAGRCATGRRLSPFRWPPPAWGKMSDDPAKPPRFPFVAALLCAACLGAAVWTWMRYEYCWEVTPVDLHSPPVPFYAGYVDNPYFGCLVRLRGTADAWCVQECPEEGTGGAFHWIAFMPGEVGGCRVRLAADVPMAEGEEIDVVGRVILVGDGPRTSDGRTYWPLCVDPTASRLHPASIAGLVIGAMGVFVFAVALRHWLRERRKLRETVE